MQNNFFGSKLNSILLLILIILMVVALVFMYKNKDLYLGVLRLDNKENIINDSNNQKVDDPVYEDTPESKMNLSSLAFLYNFEKKQDGYWYLTFKEAENITQLEHEEQFISASNIKVAFKSKPAETFRASKDLRIVYEYLCLLDQPDPTDDLETFLSKVQKINGYYWHPDNNSDYHFNGFFNIVVKDGLLTEMEEVEYMCGN
ncbi:MAG: hypothetical protein WDK96_03635 [Candidatus Paceibacterota bacterium]|jgi:hypothetical protein